MERSGPRTCLTSERGRSWSVPKPKGITASSGIPTTRRKSDDGDTIRPCLTERCLKITRSTTPWRSKERHSWARMSGLILLDLLNKTCDYPSDALMNVKGRTRAITVWSKVGEVATLVQKYQQVSPDNAWCEAFDRTKWELIRSSPPVNAGFDSQSGGVWLELRSNCSFLSYVSQV